MVSRAPKGRNKVTNGRQLFIDGDARLKVSRRFREVLASIATDLGGADRLTSQQILVQPLLRSPRTDEARGQAPTTHVSERFPKRRSS
jgi:hypothetical protein